MSRTRLLAFAAAALGSGIACSFPTVTYGNADSSVGLDATVDASGDADAPADVVEEPPPPDFPDANPDVYNPCDVDQDGFKAIGCDGGKDCNDHDKRVFPGQDFVTDVPSGPPNGDWNCLNGVEYQYPKVACSLGCAGEGFAADVACGQTGNYVKCNGVVALCGTTSMGTRVQGCR
jgi:hypothetical protein